MKHVDPLTAIAERAAMIIPTRNRPELLGETLDRLLGVGFDNVPLYVYDDASDEPEQVRETVLARFPAARIIRGKRKAGQAYGRNVLLRTIDREYAICLDDDVYFLDTGRLHEWLLSGREAERPAVVTFHCRDRQDHPEDMPDKICTRAEPSPGFLGGACLFRAPTILDVGGYRDFWGYGYEEPELALRLYARGHLLYSDPSIKVEHNHRIDKIARRDDAEYARLYARNAILMYTLNTAPAWGLARGLARSMRFVLRRKRQRPSAIAGTVLGVVDTFRYWRCRNAVPVKKVRHWEAAFRQWSDRLK